MNMKNIPPLGFVVRLGSCIFGFALALVLLPGLAASAVPSLCKLDQPLG
jgi:hypothetical protein